MQIETKSFAQAYHKLISLLQKNPVNISCRGLSLIYELTNISLIFSVPNISIYSYINSRCVPIRFIFAEFLWIMSGSNSLFEIGRFNGRMRKFSDDGTTLHGAYGPRLVKQLNAIIGKLQEDKHSRQAYATIFTQDDIHSHSKDIPCNTALQFIIRNNKLDMTVIQRSSDFVTGLSIDAIHWQMLLLLVCETLRITHRYLLPGKIYYHITSLHIYSVDDGLINAWKTEIDAKDYDHRISLRDDYYSLKNKLDKFKDAETLTDLMAIFNFSAYEQELLITLNKQFINQKNKPVR